MKASEFAKRFNQLNVQQKLESVTKIKEALKLKVWKDPKHIRIMEGLAAWCGVNMLVGGELCPVQHLSQYIKPAQVDESLMRSKKRFEKTKDGNYIDNVSKASIEREKPTGNTLWQVFYNNRIDTEKPKHIGSFQSCKTFLEIKFPG